MEEAIAQLIANYGVVGLILYFAIKEFFSYLNKNKIAETLKEANDDRKTDTDEVARELNSKQDVDLGRIDERIKTIETNHLPHIQLKLENLEIVNSEEHKKIEIAIARLEGKIENIIK